MLFNLIGNAIKFTSRGYVQVTITRDGNDDPSQDGIWLRFTIEDTGIGIPEDR